MENDFWLVSSERLKDKLWFRDEEDFKAGMNLVAVGAAMNECDIMAFVLMSNHVHFILAGEKDSAILFLNRFKTRYSRYFHKKYGITALLRKNCVDLRNVQIGDESFERALAYVQMNCVAANICLHPSAYPWGTGDSFFRQYTPNGIRVGDMTARALVRMIHSKVSMPKEYIVDERVHYTRPVERDYIRLSPLSYRYSLRTSTVHLKASTPLDCSYRDNSWYSQNRPHTMHCPEYPLPYQLSTGQTLL